MAIIDGTAGSDSLVGTTEGDIINGYEGNDFINAWTRPSADGSPIDVVNGGDGIDTLVVYAAGETGWVNLGLAGSPRYLVRSASGNYYVDAYNVEKVRFWGGSGNDTINTGDGGVTVDGGGGVDHWLADYSAITSDIFYNVSTTTSIAAAGLISISNVERITLTTGTGNDRIIGGAQGDSISTGDGDDIINARTRPNVNGAPIDYVNGGNGNDMLIVNAAAETGWVNLGVAGSPHYLVRSATGNFYIDAYSVERVQFTGGSGDDTINTDNGAVLVNGLGGIDHWLANYSAATANIVYDVANTAALSVVGLISINNIERITLSTGSGNDRITGGDQGDSISTGAGDDIIDAGSRQNTSGAPIDYVNGGDGNDTLIVNASTETQSVSLGVAGSPHYLVRSTSGNFYIDAYAVETVKFTGGSGDDTINTDAGGILVDGRGGIDHWLANYSAVTDRIVYDVENSTDISVVGLNRIRNIERITLTTGSGNDRITGGDQGDTISTGDGNDIIDAKSRQAAEGAPIDYVNGGGGNDILIVNAAAETESVSLGVAGSPHYLVRSTSGNFYIDAYAVERVKFTGGSGDDSINTDNGGILVNGRTGVDHWIADYSAVADRIVYDVANSTAISAVGLKVIKNIERITLSTGSGNDRITGGDQGDSISTGAGDDIIDAGSRQNAGGAPIDYVNGGDGNDTLIVNASSETQSVSLGVAGSPHYLVRSTSGNFYVDAYAVETVKFIGGSGDDTINTDAGGLLVDGGDGIDYWLANYSAVTDRIVYDVTNSTAISVVGLGRIVNVERINLTTGTGNDRITGGDQGDNISTGDGNDIINAKTRPTVNGAPIDYVNGGNGVDLLVVNASAETESVSLGVAGSPTFLVRSTSGNFYIDAYSIEKVKFTGGAGNDTITGGASRDILSGNGGQDTLRGGDGNDKLTGGGGADRFVFTDNFGDDVITDFSSADTEDINLRGVTAITNFDDLVNNHLQTDAGTGFAMIVDGGNTILLRGVTVGEIGNGLAYSDADFIF